MAGTQRTLCSAVAASGKWVAIPGRAWRSSFALLAAPAGKVMHHWATNRTEACTVGRYLVVSVRPMGGGKPVATVGMHRDPNGGFGLDMVTGHAKTLARPDIRALAADCVEQLNRQHQEAGLIP